MRYPALSATTSTRDGSKSNGAPVTSTTFVDSGLKAGTQYAWTVAAVDSAGQEGASSARISGTTTGSAAACYTATNYAHVNAGRAHVSGGYAYANGSNQGHGLWNVFVTTTLIRTGTNSFVVGKC
jgi:hypothetical protein